MIDKKTCPVCGETDPFPDWFCMARIAGASERGKPCSYSVEGSARGKQAMKEKLAEFTRPTSAENGVRK